MADSTSSALHLFRKAVDAKVADKIYLDDGDVFIPTSTGFKQFVATGKTNYQDRSTKEFITVGCLHDLIKAGIHTGTQYGQYKDNTEFKEKVSVLEWLELRRYLTGQITTSSQIVQPGQTSSSSITTSYSNSPPAPSGYEYTTSAAEAEEFARKRKRELLDECGMTNAEAEACNKKVKQQEMKPISRSHVLNVAQADFTFALAMANEITKSKNESSKNSVAVVGSRTGTDKSFGLGCEPKFPIILVPEPTRRARICMWNVVNFLRDGEFVHVDVAKKKAAAQGNGMRVKEPQELFMDHEGVTFRLLPVSITQKPRQWSANDFKRVVAVFADGTTFRYKGWPYKSPESIFHSVQGFHVHYVDEGPEPLCKKWFCDKVPVHKADAQRFQDKRAVVKVWERLESYIRLKKQAYTPKNWKNPNSMPGRS